jgi:hypothetical protein
VTRVLDEAAAQRIRTDLVSMYANAIKSGLSG